MRDKLADLQWNVYTHTHTDKGKKLTVSLAKDKIQINKSRILKKYLELTPFLMLEDFSDEICNNIMESGFLIMKNDLPTLENIQTQ